MNIPVFVINLDRSVQRMEEMRERLDGLGLTYERFRAFDGRALDEQFLAESYANLLPLYKDGALLGQLGCYISHVEVAQLMLSRGIPRACIMEDDVVLDSSIVDFLNPEHCYPDWAGAIKLNLA